MNFKSISFYLSLFCFPISLLAFINILYASYFDFFLSIETYFTTLIVSLSAGFGLFYYGKNSKKNINFFEQLLLANTCATPLFTLYLSKNRYSCSRLIRLWSCRDIPNKSWRNLVEIQMNLTKNLLLLITCS